MQSNQKRGMAFLISGQWLKYGLQILSLVILSRLLPPQDFGLIAMVTAVTGIANVLGDFGLSLAAIRAQVLSQGQKSNLFWFNTSIGAILAAAVFLLSPLLSAVYQDSRLTEIGRGLSISFLLAGLSVQFKVEINRRALYARLAGIDVTAQAAALIVGLGFALGGFGYWALVAQSVTVSGAVAVFSIIFANWAPGLPRRHAGTGGALRFGAATSAAQVFNYLSVNVNVFEIGRYSGAVVVGLYNRAFQLIAIPVQQIAAPLTRIMLPLMAKNSADPQRLGVQVFKAQLLLGYLLVGAVSFLAAGATPGARIVLGDGWGEAGIFIQILSVGATFQCLGYVYYWATLAAGRAKLLLWVELPGRLLAIALALLLAPISPYAAAAGGSVSLFVIWISASIMIPAKLGFSSKPLTFNAIRILIVFTIAAAVGATASQLLVGQTTALQLLAASSSWACVVAAALIIPAIRRDVWFAVSFIRNK